MPRTSIIENNRERVVFLEETYDLLWEAVIDQTRNKLWSGAVTDTIKDKDYFKREKELLVKERNDELRRARASSKHHAQAQIILGLIDAASGYCDLIMYLIQLVEERREDFNA